ncbi:hypothetical protein ACWFR1_36015 [Streptomyces sp. NPDC055103]
MSPRRPRARLSALALGLTAPLALLTPPAAAEEAPGETPTAPVARAVTADGRPTRIADVLEYCGTKGVHRRTGRRRPAVHGHRLRRPGSRGHHRRRPRPHEGQARHRPVDRARLRVHRRRERAAARVTDSRTHVTCSPMIARVRAVEVPPVVDKTVDKTTLGTSEAYKGNERESTLRNAAAACNGENACTFRPDTRASFRYYDRARVVGEAFVNCTRNTLEHSRLLSFSERGHDSVAQTYAAAGLPLNDVAKLPTSGVREEDQKRAKERPMATQFALAHERTWRRAWQWFSGDERTVVERIQPGEVSWVELQPSRERVEGWLVSKKDDYRLHAVIDGPSRAVPDRLLQRTGPMSEAEKRRCAAARPMTTTPVGVDAPASSSDKGLLRAPAPTAPGVRTAHGSAPLD